MDMELEQKEQKSWFGRNWMWVIPVGGCLTLIIVAILGAGTLFFGVTKMFSSSEPYEYALAKARSNEQVIAALGPPIEADGIINGNITYKNDSGEADFRIPIAGPKGQARIVVVATKNKDEWSYTVLSVQLEQPEEEINLLDKSLKGV